MKDNVIIISGIDTDAGKSFATGVIARQLLNDGKKEITQKFIQIGNIGHSDDIDLLRKLMGIDYTDEDKSGLTMPEIFSYTASSHFASRLDN